MKELYYENQGNNTYLVYEIKENDVVDSMSLGMLTNNKIRGLAPTTFTQMNQNRYVKFNVSAKVSAAQFFSSTVNKKGLLGIFIGIIDAMIAVEDYMLDPASILMDMDYIFTDVSTCETDLICLPIIKDTNESIELGKFFRNIIFSTQFDQTENCDHVAKMINYLNGTMAFSLNEFKKLLLDLKDQEVTTNVPQPFLSTQKPKDLDQSIQRQQTVVVPVHPENNHSFPASEIVQPPKTIPQKAAEPVATPPKVETGKQEISFLYLMQHYNKENAAAYKAQKQAKKQAALAEKQRLNTVRSQKNQPAKVQPQPAQQIPQAQPKATEFGFAVPGKPNAVIHTQQAVVQPQRAVVQPQQAVVQPQVLSQNNYSSDTVQRQPEIKGTHISTLPPKQQVTFGETTILGGNIGETTVLNVNPMKREEPYLIRVKTSEKIPVNKPVFRVGKERSYVDYFIGDNTAVSRSHANFITREGAFFVVDTNSTNHTFINGKMIPSNQETPINHGDHIRLGNEEFEFNLY